MMIAAGFGADHAQAELRMLNAVVASVDGQPITLTDVNRYGQGAGKLLPPNQRSSREILLNTMIDSALFESEFQEKGIFASDEDTNAYIDSILVQSRSSREEVQRALQGLGLTWTDYFERMRTEVQKLALLDREIRARAHVTDEEVQRYWEESPEFSLPERVEVSHIEIALPEDGDPIQSEIVRRRADEAFELAQKKSFEKAAEQYSDGPTAADGGKLGAFARGSMAGVFEEQMTGLAVGHMTAPFEADGSIHILKLDENLGRGRVPLEEVQESIRSRLYNELLDQRFQRWIREDLRNRHFVTFHLDELDDLLARSGGQI